MPATSIMPGKTDETPLDSVPKTEQGALSEGHHQADGGDDVREELPFRTPDALEDEPVGRGPEYGGDEHGDDYRENERLVPRDQHAPNDIGPQHVKFAVREEQYLGNAEDQVEAHREQHVDQAYSKSVDY